MWRGVSLRKLAFLLLGPMIAEALASLFSAWMVLQAKKSMGYAEWQHMLIPALGSLGYAVSALAAGRWVTPRWAPRLMTGAILAVATLGLAAMAIKAYAVFAGLSFFIGFALGHYYTPFQINMSHVRPFHTLAWSIAFYNIAWGIGAAVGPYYGSSLRLAPMGLLAAVVLTLAAVHTVLVIVSVRAPPPLQEAITTAAFHSTPRQRRMVLVAFIAVGLVIRGLYITLWPGLGGRNGWDDGQIGLGQFLLFLPVPLAAPLWARLRRRLDRPWIMLTAMGVGLAGLIVLSQASSWETAVVCLVAVGVMESCVVFHAIYYMNADPDPRGRARNIGVFEMMAGVSSILGPVTLGLLAWDNAASWRPYAFGCAMLAGSIAWVLYQGSSPRNVQTVLPVSQTRT